MLNYYQVEKKIVLLQLSLVHDRLSLRRLFKLTRTQVLQLIFAKSGTQIALQ